MMYALLLMLLCALAAWIIPCALLWIINTLFKTRIPYDVHTWFAALLLMLFVGGLAAL